MRRFTFACAILALCLAPSFAQDEKSDQRPPAPMPMPMGPATQLENELHLRGAVVVKGYTDIGEIVGNDGVRVTAVELTRPGTSDRTMGLAITVTQAGDPSILSVSYVDFDEIDPLLAALDAIARIDRTSPTNLQHFDAEYRTRSELEIANVDRDGGRYLRVQSIQMLPTTQIVVAAAHFPANRITELRRHLETARDTLIKARDAAAK
jgi:hypothetical protein